MTLIIDPPEGWKYGFPKPLPKDFENDKDFNLKNWLLEQGYPKELIGLALKHSRYWDS